MGPNKWIVLPVAAVAAAAAVIVLVPSVRQRVVRLFRGGPGAQEVCVCGGVVA
jgi:hypothetical protein